MAADLQREDQLGAGFASFLATLLLAALLYAIMLGLLTVAHAVRNNEEIVIRNDDDARDVRYKRRKREGLPDDFFLTTGYSYDWIFVFQVRNEWDELSDFQKEFSMKRVINSLTMAGLETSQFYSVQRDEVYCKIRVPRARLVAQADKTNYKLLLDSREAELEVKRGRTAKQPVGPPTTVWKGRLIEDQFAQSEYSVYDYIYGQYQQARAAQPGGVAVETSQFPRLYKKHELENGVMSEFGSVDRIKLMKTIFEGPKSDKCCGMNLSLLVSNECILGAFPLHDYKMKVMLEKKWLRAHQLPWNQPIWDVKCYFGEKVALFFAFVGHLNGWLMLPALFGLGVYVHMAAASSYTVGSQIWFGIFLAVWATFMLEFWKRKECTLVMMWGMTGFEEAEPDRPEFEGELVPSPVDGESSTYFPESEAAKAVAKTTTSLAVVVLGLVAVFAAIFALSSVMNIDEIGNDVTMQEWVDLAQLIPALLCALVIMVSSRLFSGVAVALTDMENHRTDTQYEDAVIVKTFIFEFFNSYSAPFYVIFLKAYAPGDACVGGCVRELHYLMGSIFFSIILVQSLLQIYEPVVASRKKEAEEREGADPSKQMSSIEKQYMLQEYDPMFGSFKHFRDIAIQFGYAVLFSVAFPLAPLLAFVSTYFEIRVDSWVLLQKCRRVVPTGVEDIGTWQSVFETLASVSVISNMGILFLVSESEINVTWVSRMLLFLVAEHAIFLVQMLFALLVEDVPMSTTAQLERQEFLAGKLIDNLPDDDLEAVVDEDDDDDAANFIDQIYDEDEDPAL